MPAYAVYLSLSFVLVTSRIPLTQTQTHSLARIYSPPECVILHREKILFSEHFRCFEFHGYRSQVLTIDNLTRKKESK